MIPEYSLSFVQDDSYTILALPVRAPVARFRMRLKSIRDPNDFAWESEKTHSGTGGLDRPST